MRAWGLLGLALLVLGSCGDSDAGQARTAEQVCDEVCGWLEECLVEPGSPPLERAECVQSCEAEAEMVGLDCLQAVSDTFACLRTCDLDSVTNQQILDCEDAFLSVDSVCELPPNA